MTDATPRTPVERLAYNVREAAQALGVGTSFIYMLAKDGRLNLTRLGGRTLVQAEDLKRMLAENKTTAPSRKVKTALATRLVKRAAAKTEAA